LLPFWRARFITSSESTTNPSLSHLAPERLLRRNHLSKGWKNMWKPSSVSDPAVCPAFPAHTIPVYTAKAIDRYIQLRADAQPNGTPEIDPRLSAIIETIFNRCIADGEYKQVRAFWDMTLRFPGILFSQRQSVSPSNHGDWISSSESTNKPKTFLRCPMPWKP